ncbi:MAG: leucine-rich repeat domain-containing protein [Clostridia bacterium]|nr:leucine-rich repeat domain-containing protein [Clostridia bacterium]
MKKFVKLLIISVMILASVLSFAACGGNSDKDSEAGIVCKKLTGDDFYTVIGYNAEENETSLNISVKAKDKYGDTVVIGRIRKGAFDGNTTLKEIVVTDETENGTLTIDEGAFKNMRALEKITLPFVGANRFSEVDQNVYGIDLNDLNEQEKQFYKENKATDKERAFGYIFGEEENAASSKITFTYGGADGQTADFYIPVALTEITIKADKATSIPMYAFCGLTRVETVTLSGKINAIGRAAFKDMDKLSKVNIPSGVKVIYDEAFAGTAKLKVFGENGFKFDDGSLLTEIREEAFKDTRLQSFDISGTQVTKIGNYAFAGNSNLSSVKFGTSVTEIGAYLFADCDDLTELTYTGTMAQCNEIVADVNWYACSELEKIVCSNGNINLGD